MASTSRKTAALAAVSVFPLVVGVEFWAPQGPVRWMAAVWGLAAIAIPWAVSRAWSRRVMALTSYAGEIPGAPASRPRPAFHDDELGELARSLARTASQVEVLVERLRTELGRREAILGSMTDAVLAVDARLNVSFCNEAFVRAAGHAITEGVQLLNVFRDPGLVEMLRRVINSGETVQQRLSIAAQEDHWFDVYATPLAGPAPHSAIAILHDVTPMVRVERAQRDFVANVSHEFRTPLATITGYAETLLDNAWDDAAGRRRFLEIIQATSVRLTHIAADLITLSQLDAGGARSRAAPILVDEVVSSAVRAVEPVAGTRGISIETREICSARILGHRIALEQALVNLLDNGIKFSPPGSAVVVRARVAAADRVEISVADAGIGIPAEDLTRIFERFYRVDKARSREVGGTGLGLSIVQHAVEQMHGTIHVDSQLGKGSCFTITLPRYDGNAGS